MTGRINRDKHMLRSESLADTCARCAGPGYCGETFACESPPQPEALLLARGELWGNLVRGSPI